ncbi:hypothetical protein N7490_010104 [Penicillium lividum]|nr:hypothetical protein N7490_010104 [Penicillium lividum]
MTRGHSFAILCGLSTLVSATSSPYSATWSGSSYGPDGPWNAVLVALGNNKQQVALYPGDRWASTILLDTICSTPNLTGADSGSSCLADDAGTFDIATSNSVYIPSDNSNDTSDMAWISGADNAFVNKFGGDAYVKEGQLGDLIFFGGITVLNASISGIYEAYQEYPNGKRYPVEVGTLALGGPALNQTVNNVTYNLLGAYAWQNNQIPSYSWGMHIGSVEPSIAGSLVMGGYDQDRVVGNVSSQQVNATQDVGTLDITLYDIGLGVAEGESPWQFDGIDGLLKQTNSSGDHSASVQIDPTRPYLYLPQDTCDAIAGKLPVSYSEDLGLYFWNTSDSQFQHITDSPAYLSFTFENNGGSDSSMPNITIKVPFTLLKLTLQSPLVDHNITYFPCYRSDEYVLGRAFLQAAFLGTNWQDGQEDGYWFLAQAPGPNLQGDNVTSIAVSDTTIQPGSGSWEDSWSGWWTVTPIQNHHGLSQGAKIGIGIGCGIAGALLICAVGLLVARFMRKGKKVDPSEDEATELTTSNNAAVAGPPPDTPVQDTPENHVQPVGVFEQANGSNMHEHVDSHEEYGGDKPPPWSPPLHPLPGPVQPFPGHDQLSEHEQSSAYDQLPAHDLSSGHGQVTGHDQLLPGHDPMDDSEDHYAELHIP